MQSFAVLALAALFVSPWVSVDARIKHRLAVRGALTGGAGAMGAGGGYVAGSLLKSHGHGLQAHTNGWPSGHGIGLGHKHGDHEKVIVKNVYLKHHQEFPLPIVSEDPVAPIYPIAPVLPVAPGLLPVGKPIAPSVHAEPAVNTAPIVHAPPAPIVAEKPTAPALTGSQIVIKKPEPQYKGHYIYKKFVKNPGHHFGVHNYQISFSRRPMPVIVKKHFVLHPSPIVLKPVFLKKPVAKPDIPIVNSEAAVPIIKEGPPIADAEIAVPATRPVIKETPVATGHVIENTAEPVAEEPLVEHGAPILEILGSIFDAPLLNTGAVAHGIPIADKAC